MPTVVVAALTTSVRDSTRAGRSPVSVFLPAGQPLPDEGSLLAFQVMTIDKVRLAQYIARLTPVQLVQVDAALRTSFGL
jgi:mRNA-degrading endonuclease toxin of MazEF toxin-antitoxin module